MTQRQKTRTCVVALLIGAAFMSGYWSTQPLTGAAATMETAIRDGYACPMHPQFTSGEPGECPVCGMRLVATQVHGTEPHVAPPAGVQAGVQLPGAVHLDAHRQAIGGLRVEPVARLSAEHNLRVVARVTPAQTQTYTVTAGIDGFVMDAAAVTTGSHVRKGDYLATIASPDAFPAIQSFLIGLDAIDRLTEGGGEGPAQARITAASANFQQRTEKLYDVGMSEAQVAEIRQTREIPHGIRIVAPADGTVLARNISQGQRFQRGTEWFRLADLSSVWLVAEIVGTEASYIRPGAIAMVTVPGQRKPLTARVSDSLPLFDAERRTQQVRLELSNQDQVLRPDMFVDVDLPIAMPPAVVVPVDAVLDSGMRSIVFVETSAAVFAPRQVEIGWRLGNQVQIVQGLDPGERIVTAGTFLVDSESRMVGVGPHSGE